MGNTIDNCELKTAISQMYCVMYSWRYSAKHKTYFPGLRGSRVDSLNIYAEEDKDLAQKVEANLRQTRKKEQLFAVYLFIYLIINVPPQRLHMLILGVISKLSLLMLIKYFIYCDPQFLNLRREVNPLSSV